MSKKFDIVAVTGKYKDRDGNEKSRYVTIGAVIETSKGLSLKLEAVPVGWDGWAGLYEPKAKEDAGRSRSAGRSGGGHRDDPDSDVPFAPMGKGAECLSM